MKREKRNLHAAVFSRPLTAAMILTCVAALILPTPALAGKGNYDNPGVIPPQATPNDHTYGEWAAMWWQWALGSPADQSPLFDETGEFSDVGQSGPVWFLAGTFSGVPTERTCTIPAGKAIFIPVLNSASFQFCTDDPLPDDCVQNNYECLREPIRLPDNVQASCEIDGQSVKNLTAYHIESPAFGLNTTDGSLAAAFGFPVCFNAPCVDDGYYLMLAPLSAGEHTIHFAGTNGDFSLDVTYHITVASTE